MTSEEALEIIKAYKKKLENSCSNQLDEDIKAFDIAIKALKDNKGLRLLIDWAVDCGFGYDNIPEEYEKYKEEISDMHYTEGLIYIAKKEAENND